jgi:glutamine synthetase
MVFFSIIAGVEYGITNQIEAPPKIWGNAHDEQYAQLCPSLPKNWHIAQDIFVKATYIDPMVHNKRLLYG